MSLEKEQLRVEIEQALEKLAELRGDERIRRIRQVVLNNLERERLQTFMDGSCDGIEAYVQHVDRLFAKLHKYLHQLQIERSYDVWEPLFERMQNWAYNFLLRKNFTKHPQTQELAAACATDAALILLNAYFPYDTEFDPWAHILVQNSCRKFISKNFRKSVVSEKQFVELDENLVSSEQLPLETRALQKEADGELLRALAQLSKARRRVIELAYFDELEAAEIAQILGKSVNAIYSLQFRALQDLRKILGQNRDNLNE